MLPIKDYKSTYQHIVNEGLHILSKNGLPSYDLSRAETVPNIFEDEGADFHFPKKDLDPGLYTDDDYVLYVSGLRGPFDTPEDDPLLVLIHDLLKEVGISIWTNSSLCIFISEILNDSLVSAESYCPAPTHIAIFKYFKKYNKAIFIPTLAGILGSLVGGISGEFEIKNVITGAVTAELALLINLLSVVASSERNKEDAKKRFESLFDENEKSISISMAKSRIEEKLLLLILDDGNLNIKEIESRLPSLKYKKIAKILKRLSDEERVVCERRGLYNYYRLPKK